MKKLALLLLLSGCYDRKEYVSFYLQQCKPLYDRALSLHDSLLVDMFRPNTSEAGIGAQSTCQNLRYYAFPPAELSR